MAKSSYYRIRDARAKAAGYRSYAEERKARAVAKAQGLADQLPPEGIREHEASKPKASRSQIFPTDAGTSVQTTAKGKGYGVLTRQLASHGSAPARLVVTTKAGKRIVVNKHGRAADKGTRSGRGILGGAAQLTPAMVADQVNASLEDRYSGETVTADDIAEVVVELLENWESFDE